MIAVFLLWVMSCGKGADDCGASELAAGSAEATIEGEAWASDAVRWSWAGSSLQINSESSDGWLVSMVAQTDTAGDDLATAVELGEFPIEVDLLEGGFATLYPVGESFSYTSNKAAGGTLTLSAADDQVIQGCFSFEAASADGFVVEVEAGALNADLGR